VTLFYNLRVIKRTTKKIREDNAQRSDCTSSTSADKKSNRANEFETSSIPDVRAMTRARVWNRRGIISEFNFRRRGHVRDSGEWRGEGGRL